MIKLYGEFNSETQRYELYGTWTEEDKQKYIFKKIDWHEGQGQNFLVTQTLKAAEGIVATFLARMPLESPRKPAGEF